MARAVFKDLKQSLVRDIALPPGCAAPSRAVRPDGDRVVFSAVVVR